MLREWNCDKKIERSEDNSMEGKMEKNVGIAIFSDTALTLFEFINFFKEHIIKLIFATYSKLSSKYIIFY
jgi:hypothetical protein